MMEQSQQELSQSMTRIASSNADALQIRLNPEPLLVQIELFLRGERLNYEHNNETGQVAIQKISCGKPLANPQGVQMILSWVTLIINNQTVQGNLKQEELYQLMKDLKLGLAYNLMTCWKEWGIDKHNRRFIVRGIENCCRMYTSRALDNMERESYAQSIRHIESSRMSDSRKVPLDKQ